MKLSPRLTWAIRGVLTGVFVGLILFRVGPNRILGAFANMAAKPVIIALMLGIPRLGFKISRWKVLSGCAIPGVGWKRAGKSLLVGTAGAIITPGRIGQVTSSLMFRRDRRMILSGLALLDPLSDLMIVALMAVFVIMGNVAGTGAAALILILIFLAKRLGLILARRSGKLAYAGKAMLVVDPPRLLFVGLLSLVIYIFNLLQFYLLLNAIHDVSFSVAAQSLPLIFLAVAVPFTIAGFGVREAVAALVLTKHGLPPEIGIQASFVLFVINLGAPAIIGACIAGRMRTGTHVRP